MPTALVIICYCRCHTSGSIKNTNQNSNSEKEPKTAANRQCLFFLRANKKVEPRTYPHHRIPTLFASTWNGFFTLLLTKVTQSVNPSTLFADLGNSFTAGIDEGWAMRQSVRNVSQHMCHVVSSSYRHSVILVWWFKNRACDINSQKITGPSLQIGDNRD
jgi:hypothetical protein